MTRTQKLKVHIPLHSKDLHSSIHSQDQTLLLFFSESCLTASIPKKTQYFFLLFVTLAICHAFLIPAFQFSIFPHFSHSVLPHVPVSRSGFLYKPVSLQISSLPHPPPSLINVTSHRLHQSRRHLPAIPSQTATKLLPHASHA
jgi:hypothetical protein